MREAQQETKEQFQLVLTGFDGGDLEQYYNDLSEILDRSEVKTNEVCQRINAVEGAVETLLK